MYSGQLRAELVGPGRPGGSLPPTGHSSSRGLRPAPSTVSEAAELQGQLGDAGGQKAGPRVWVSGPALPGPRRARQGRH